MNIENFTLLEFLNQSKELIEEYVVALQYLPPQKTKRQLIRMKFKHVEMIKQSIDSESDKDVIKVVSKVQKISKKQVLDMTIVEYFGIMNSIREQLRVIVAAEERGLTSSHTNLKWEAVNGTERMSMFGIYNTLDNLTGKKPHLYQYYMNMEYSEIFMILLKWKTEADLEREMNQIKTK